MSDPLANVIHQVTSALTRMGIRYAIVGSLASSAHGAYRATADGDLLAEIPPQRAQELARLLGPDWYADGDMMERALRAHRSFNVIHIPTAQKVDIFPALTEFHTKQLERATAIPVFRDLDQMSFLVATPEDVLVSKLHWFRLGGETSQLQWNDITGLLERGSTLDFGYMHEWARRLGVDDLLLKAIRETGRGQQS